MRTTPDNTHNRSWFNVHAHSHFSVLDAISTPDELVIKAANDQQPAITLSDHGNGSGWIQMYQAGKKHGVDTFLGVEGYLLDPWFEGDLADSGKADRYHFGVAARNVQGYHALAKFMSLTHTRPRFSRFPRATLSDLTELGQNHGEDLMFTTGCLFGLLQQELIKAPDMERGIIAATKIAKMYAAWFPNCYLEVQHHNIQHDGAREVGDDQIVAALMKVAQRASLPVVATADCHYADSKHKKAHALMKRMVYGGAEDEFPGDSFHMPTGQWVQEHYTDQQWSKITEGLNDYGSKYDLVIKPLDKFVAQVPEVTDTPNSTLKKLCTVALTAWLKIKKIAVSKHKVYWDRLAEELSVIKAMKMGNYFMLMKRCIDYLRGKQVAVEARGSANASLVLYMLRVTQIDPIEWGADFARFLSLDRVGKMPDVDIDIEDTGRWLILEFVAQQWECVQIGTYGLLGETYDKQGNVTGSSVLRTYLSYLRHQVEAFYWKKEQQAADNQGRKPAKGQSAERAKKVFYSKYGSIKDIEEIRGLNERDYLALKQLARMKVHRSYGVHAAGVLVGTDTFKISDWVPTMLVASSNTRVSQFTMHDVEQLGLLKADWLGQITLTTMKNCQAMIGRNDPTDFEWMPPDDPKAMAMCRTGRTDTGLFHVEGWTKAKGAKELSVRKTSDLVLMQALYMPAVMESGATAAFVRRRQKKEKVPVYKHKITEQVVGSQYEWRGKGNTLGVMVFQDQVLTFGRLIGLQGDELQSFFSVVKDSGRGARDRNVGRMAAMKQRVYDLAKGKGMPDDELDFLWRSCEAMGAYGFNIAHTSGYGLRSYRTAYLKAHYTLEYMCALLQSAVGRDQEPAYIKEARRLKIRILPPDVNVSEDNYTIDHNTKSIVRGLQSIKGIGPAAAAEVARHAPFKDMDDFCTRVNPRTITGVKDYRESQGRTIKGVIGVLMKANAMRSVPLALNDPPPF